MEKKMHSQSNSEMKRRIGFHQSVAAAVVALASLFLFTMAHTATISVTNNGELVNGDTTSPEALFANPGQDGISLPEYDFEGDGRIRDGDKDGLAVVDIGADEYTVQQAMPWLLPLLLYY